MPPDATPILLLEDDPDILEATALILREEGFGVLTAPDLASAELLARQVGRCIILLDLSLEGDPQAFIRNLHASGDWQGQVLLFSAGDRLDERASELGADGVISKPFDIDALVAELRARARATPNSEVHAP